MEEILMIEKTASAKAARPQTTFRSTFASYRKAEKQYESKRGAALNDALSSLENTKPSYGGISEFSVGAGIGISRHMLGSAQDGIVNEYLKLREAAVELRASFPGKKPLSAKLNRLWPTRHAQYWFNAQNIAANAPKEAAVPKLDMELTPKIQAFQALRNVLAYLSSGFAIFLAASINGGRVFSSLAAGLATAAFAAGAVYYNNAAKCGETMLNKLSRVLVAMDESEEF